MKKKCIFKVSAIDETYKVVAVEKFSDEKLWAVMKGRVYAQKPFLYRTSDEAINRAIYLAKLELNQYNLLFFEP